MSYTVVHNYEVTLNNISIEVQQKPILKLIKSNFPNLNVKINQGPAMFKIGREIRRVYIKLGRLEDVDEIMRNRSSLKLHGEPLLVTRTLPKTYPLYDRCVTGVKINIQQPINQDVPTAKLNESDLRNYFQKFGSIRYCKWTNDDQTEALFAFMDYDTVDRIIFCDSSPIIKNIKINLEKTWTEEDYTTYERPYVIHVTNLPICVTSEEVSKHFNVPSGLILLDPCFRVEQAHVVGGRSSSEAWIKNFSDEESAVALARVKTETFIRTNRIQCEAMLEPIDDDELCERFQEGRCPYLKNTCNYKHFSCSQSDTCEDSNCLYGHTMKRKTKSIKRPTRRLEDAQYRVKFSNLPANITRETLLSRLKIDSGSAKHLILQSTEEGGNSTSRKMAYLIRQPLENKLRQQIDRWNEISFSSSPTERIRCQLELQQEYYDWNDSPDIARPSNNTCYASPAPSVHSARSDRTNPTAWYSSVASTASGRLNTVKKPYTNQQSPLAKPSSTCPQTAPRHTPAINTIGSKLDVANRQPPTDLSSLSPEWHWNNKMIPIEFFDHDGFYCLESQSKKQKNIVVKIYSSKTKQEAELRAQRERIALEKLIQSNNVPRYFKSNFDIFNIVPSNKEPWIIMKLCNGERLVDYIRNVKLDLREALHLTRRLLGIVKQMHTRNVIHRDIQPKNILVESRPDNQENKLMVINFGSAWINDNQAIQFFENVHEQLGKPFYHMPQFATRETDTEPDENTDQLKQFQRSTTIDATGVGAILFWIITGHEPKEAQDISGKPPHKLHDNRKIIERKVRDITGFRIETKILEHILRHLMLTFDRCFAAPNQQWTVDELDYQFQIMLALIDGDKNSNNYLPSLENDIVSTPSSFLPMGDSFVYVISLIHYLKNQFAVRYPDHIRWSTEAFNQWCSQNGEIEHHHMMIIPYQSKDMSLDIHWKGKILKEQQVTISIEVKDHEKIGIELPLGSWEINQQTNDFHIHLRKFDIEMKILTNILCKSIAS